MKGPQKGLLPILAAASMTLAPSAALAIPAQVALAGISFMIPVLPVLCLILVSAYLLATRNIRLKGFLGRLPGAFLLVMVTVLLYTFFVKLSSTLGGLIDPSAEERLIAFITDNAVTRADVDRIDETIWMVRDAPPERWNSRVVIEPREAARGIREGNLLVVDVRLAEEYAAGHVAGAVRFPRGEMERASPDSTWMLASDRFFDSLHKVARENGKRLAFCCSYGVSVSARTVMELRKRDIDAVMISDGCNALKKYGVPFHGGPAVSNVDRFVGSGVLDTWIRDGRVNTIVATWPVVLRNGVGLPEGPLVVVSNGNSIEDRTLRILTSAAAQSVGITVAGQSVVGREGMIFGPSAAAAQAGAILEAGLGMGFYFVVLLACFLGILFLAGSLRSPGVSRIGKINRIAGLVLVAVVVAVIAALLEGTWAANRVNVLAGQHKVAYGPLFLVTAALIFHRLNWPGGVPACVDVTRRPIDGLFPTQGKFVTINVLLALALAMLAVSSSPILALFTALVLLAVELICIVRRTAIRLMLISLGHRLKHVAKRQCPDGEGICADKLLVGLLMNIASAAFPKIWIRRGPPAVAMRVRTYVPGKPGKVLVGTRDEPMREVGIFTLCDGTGRGVDQVFVPRVGLVIGVAALTGLDLDVVWKPGARVPFASVIMSRGKAQPGRAVPDVLHRQVLAMIADDRAFSCGGLRGENAVLSGERYTELAIDPTPLSFSVLAARSAKHGAAHAVGLLFGFRDYFAVTVRLGARIYESVSPAREGLRRNRIRNMAARNFVRALDAVFSDFVMPGVVSFTSSLQRETWSRGRLLGAIDRIVNRFTLWQEMTALAHAILLNDAIESSGGQVACDGFRGLAAGAGERFIEPASWEIMPAGRFTGVPGTVNLNIGRMTSSWERDGFAGLPDSIHACKRAEYYRGAFRGIMSGMISHLGERLLDAGRDIGMGDLVFFAGRKELRQVLGTTAGRSPDLVAELVRRKAEWEMLRSVDLPVTLRVSDIESLEWDESGCPIVAAPDEMASLGPGFLVSGRVPVTGIVRVCRKGQAAVVPRPDEILVVVAPDPVMIAGMPDCRAILAEAGGRLSHAAMLARELGMTLVSGVVGATASLSDGDEVSIDDRCVVRVLSRNGGVRENGSGDVRSMAVPLSDAGLECGNKAAALARLIRAGFPVPPGVAIPIREAEVFVDDIQGLPPAAAADIWNLLQPMDMGAGFIVRSSSAVEDGSHSSFAGMFLSVPGVRNSADLADAFARCLSASASPGISRLAARLGMTSVPGMGLVIQPLVPADHSGVAVSSCAKPGAGATVVMIESERGPGGVVIGTGRPPAFAWDPAEDRLETVQAADPGQAPPEAVLKTVGRLVNGIETLFGHPVDVEWCSFGHEVRIVQARPVVERKSGPVAAPQ